MVPRRGSPTSAPLPRGKGVREWQCMLGKRQKIRALFANVRERANGEETGIAQRVELVDCDKELRRWGCEDGSKTRGVAPKRLIALGTPISGAVGPYGPCWPRPMSGGGSTRPC